MKRGLLSGVVAMLALALAAGLNGVPAKYAEYAGWEVVADKGLPMGGPHAGPGKVVYANPVAAKDWKSGKPLALGSIVVKRLQVGS